MTMRPAEEIEQLLEICEKEVREIIESRFNSVSDSLTKNSLFEDDFVEMGKWAFNDPKKFRAILSASCISDLLPLLRNSTIADKKIDQGELDQCAEILSRTGYRYFWRDEYQVYAGEFKAPEFLKLLQQWQKDKWWLGGDYENGGILRPFRSFVFLACKVSKSLEPFQNYCKCFELAASTILSLGGWSPGEEEYYADLINTHRRYHEYLSRDLQNDVAVEGREGLNHDGQGKKQKVVSDVSTREILEEGLRELNSLVGVESVKKEVESLANFLLIRQHRVQHNMPVPNQSLHFVFTGNPGTGKTTVARILAKIFYGFGIIKRPEVTECDRSSLVGGYVGQTAIKTSEKIDEACGGVLFIDEAYTLSQQGDGADDSFGKESIDTLLKRMEDDRDRLIVIVAGYPALMGNFLNSNPGLKSRFTRFIKFEDYNVSDLCKIFNGICETSGYSLTQEAKGNLAILFNLVCARKEEGFGNARFVRNAFDIAYRKQADRLSLSKCLSKEDLAILVQDDIPFEMTGEINGPFDLISSKWFVKCPTCEKTRVVGIQFIGQFMTCSCGSKFRCPWWSLDEKSVTGLKGYARDERDEDFLGYDVLGSVSDETKDVSTD